MFVPVYNQYLHASFMPTGCTVDRNTRNRTAIPRVLYMAEQNEQGTGQGTGTTGTTTPASTTNSGTGQTQTQTGTTTQATGTDQAKTGFTYAEDRSKWIPQHRLSEVTTQKQAAEAKANELQRQIQALTNTAPKDEQAVKADQIQEQFYKMFPWAKSFKDLSDEQIKQVLDAPNQARTATEYVNHGWERHAKTMTGTLVSEVADIIGGKLDEDGQADLKLVFGNYIQREVKKAEASGQVSPELQRYMDGDESLVKDFAKKFADRWFTPARRQVASQEVARSRPVPRSTGRSQQTQVERPKEFKTMDDRLNFLADKYKEDGGQFSK